jgi:hypothetical protein
MTEQEAQKILGTNFLSIDSLNSIAKQLGIALIEKSEPVPYDANTLKENKDCILFYAPERFSDGRPITLAGMRLFFGTDPAVKEPCFYNQDWYVEQGFATASVEPGWHLISKNVIRNSRGKNPEFLKNELAREESFPSAVLTAFAFFAFYFSTGEKLWVHDFIWCNDHDDNGDRIYTGRYEDPLGKNKNGFNVHRHLKIRECYGAVKSLK